MTEQNGLNKRMPKLIVYTHGGGRLGNQLLNHAHLIAFWKEHCPHSTIINAAMISHSQYFENNVCVINKRERSAVFSLAKSFYDRLADDKKLTSYIRAIHLAHRLATMFPGCDSLTVNDATGLSRELNHGRKLDCLDLGDIEAVKAAFGRARILVLAGWGMRSWPLVKKHSNLVIERLRPRAEIVAHAESALREFRSRCDFVVGVQIRRGDYQRWKGGIFYFPLERYVSWMNEVAERFSSRGRVGFVVCADSSYPEELLTSAVNAPLSLSWQDDCSLVGPMMDIAKLSLCDLLVIPPSTFGFWAAFVRNLPVLCASSLNDDMRSKPVLQDSIFDAVRDPAISLAVH